MNLFQRRKIEGYRRLHNLEIEMRPLTVMIGANGVSETFTFGSFSLSSQNERTDSKFFHIEVFAVLVISQLMTNDQ